MKSLSDTTCVKAVVPDKEEMGRTTDRYFSHQLCISGAHRSQCWKQEFNIHLYIFVSLTSRRIIRFLLVLEVKTCISTKVTREYYNIFVMAEVSKES